MSRTAFLIASLALAAFGQNTPGGAPAAEAKGIPPRAAPADYQAQAPAGTLTLAADFLGHSIPTAQGNTYTTEDFVVVELAFFGPAGERGKISLEDFSMRINDKKSPVPGQPYGATFKSLKDPEWLPPDTGEPKSKTGINTGDRAAQGDSKPLPPKMPIALQRVMEQRVQKVALPEGDRVLPQAGLIFFPYHGKVEGIHSIELYYAGPAGKATLTLQP